MNSKGFDFVLRRRDCAAVSELANSGVEIFNFSKCVSSDFNANDSKAWKSDNSNKGCVFREIRWKWNSPQVTFLQTVASG